MEQTLVATGQAGLRGDGHRGCLAGRKSGQSRPAMAAALFGGGALTLGFTHRIQSHAGPLGPAAGRQKTRRGTRCPLSVIDSKSQDN